MLLTPDSAKRRTAPNRKELQAGYTDMSSNREKRERRNANIKRTAVSIVMFSLVAGGVITYSMYQQRKTTEAQIYERNAEGGEAAGYEYISEAQPETMARRDPDETFKYYLKFRDEWQLQEDGTVIYRDKHYRRASYIKATLAVGVDRSDGLGEGVDVFHSGQNDVDLVIAQDTTRNTIRILMLPRNAIVEMGISDDNGKWTGKDYDQLCLAYAYGDGGETSVQNTVDAVSWMLLGMQPDHYAVTDMGILNRVNDAVGGVTVTIPNDELVKVDPTWTKGSVVTLQGDEAERFIRYRDTGADNTALYRMQQHSAYMLGFYDTLQAKARVNSGIVTDLYDLVQNDMLTDLQKDEFLKLVLDAVSTGTLSAEDITTLPGVAIAADENYEWDRVFVDYNSAIPVILDMFYREI